MKQTAVDKARRRLARAEAALKRAEVSKDFAEFETAWGDFLLDLNRVPGSLETGAKSNPRSRQWFGQWKKAARNDELLAYLRQARNEEEHGIESIAVLHPGGIRVEPGGRPSFRIIQDASNKVGFRLEPIISPGITLVPGHPELAPVRDQHARMFNPPTEHLGVALTDTSPAALGNLALRYYATLIQKAATLVTAEDAR